MVFRKSQKLFLKRHTHPELNDRQRRMVLQMVEEIQGVAVLSPGVPGCTTYCVGWNFLKPLQEPSSN
jgi:hypothetical protein